MRFAENLARLSVAVRAGQPLPDDLADWITQRLEEAAPAALRLQWRNSKLRMAGRLIGGSIYRQTREILRISDELAAGDAGELRSPACLVERLVLEATLLGPMPAERRLSDLLSIASAMQSFRTNCMDARRARVDD